MIPENSEIFTPAELPTDPAELALTLLNELHRLFPVFATFKPLRIGIHADLFEALPEVPHAVIKAALRRQCRHPAYLISLAKGGDRLNLDGQPAGTVSEEHRTKIRDGRKVRPKKPRPEPTAPEAPPIAAPQPGRPILKLKPKAGPVVAVSVARRVKP